MDLREVDYIVVGAGSAGCVIASRLSESGKYTVALIEAGGEDRSFWFRAPLGYGKLFWDPRFNWSYVSEPQQALTNKPTYQPRGKVLGGTGSINGMVFLRGQQEDFDYWRQLGNVGWGYDDVLPYFKKSEHREAGGNEFRGTGGPLTISQFPKHELAEAFIDAAVQAGFSRNEDFNGARQEGFGRPELNVRNGRRWSTVDAFLRPASKRKNLIVLTHAIASRIVMQDRRATGVEFRQGGTAHSLSARREVILAAGVFNSPQLLQASGIGPADLLRGLDIPLVQNLPGVGANLDDHFVFNLTYRCTRKITINDVVNNPFRRYAMGLQYLLFRNGLMATNGQAAYGFVRSSPDVAAPDLLIRLRLFTRSNAKSWGDLGLDPFSCFDVGASLMHAESRGSVRIKSADVTVQPEIRLNSFSTSRDHETAIRGFRVIQKIMSMPAIRPYVLGDLNDASALMKDEDVLQYCREKGAANLHSTSTCRMGVDPHAVVDPRLRVHGIEGLRVIDASIMPRAVGANTNAATIMIGEKGAAMTLEDAR